MSEERDTQITFWVTEKEKDQYQKFAKDKNNSGLSEFIRKSIRINMANPSLLEEFKLPEEESILSPEILRKFDELARLREEKRDNERESLNYLQNTIESLNDKVDWLMDQRATTKKKISQVKKLKGESEDLEVLGLG